MRTVPKMLVSTLIGLAVLVVLLFLPAGTFNYWQAWVFVVFYISTRIFSAYLLRSSPAVLQRRSRGGPRAENRIVQKVAMGALWISLAVMVVFSALDHRFGWSSVPIAICLVGDVLVAVGLGIAMLVILQNSHASATVRVESGQQVVSTGLYKLVRHPMYAGNVIMMVGIPLALGSYWGLVFVIPGVIGLGLRIRDEEKLLYEELIGYREYTQEVRYRLVPGMW